MHRVRRRAIARCAAVALAVTACAAFASAEQGVLQFERFGAREGLRAETISSLLQDRTGLLWIGTRDGLALFDGSRFRTFHHRLGAGDSIADNDLRMVFEDSAGRLWIGTNTAGLERLDRATWAFEHHRHDSADPHSLSHDSVYAMAEDAAGRLWVGTQDGLNLFDPHTGRFERVDLGPGKAPESEYVYALHVAPDGALWVGTIGGGLGRRDPSSGRFRWFRNSAGDPASLPSNRVAAVVTDAQGAIWVGTQLGVSRLDPRTGVFERAERALVGELYDQNVVALAIGSGTTLWVGSLGGLYALDTASGAARLCDHRVGSEQVSSAGRILALAVDRSGTLWVGTWSEGLNHVPRPASLFAAIRKDGVNGLSYADATAVLEDRAGRLWIGTFGGGLFRRDPDAARFRRYPAAKDDPVRGIDTGVQRLLEDRDGRIWIGSVRGVYMLDPRTERVTAFEHDPGNALSLGRGYVTALAEDAAGTLWVGTGGSGLCRLRPDGRGFDRIVHSAGDPATLSDDYVSSIAEDRRGRLWVGTRSGGLNLLDRATGRVRRLAPVAGDATSLSHLTVTALLEDRAGTTWVATAGGGLNRVVERDGNIAFERITDAEGLADNSVVSLAEADDGSLWVATRGGLSHIDPRRGIVQNYDTGDGLPTILFNTASASRGRSLIRFGSPGGVVEIPRGMPFESPAPSPTVVTSIRTPAGPFATAEPAWSLGRANVPYGEVLTLEFAVLDYRDTTRHRFAYRLGPSEPWINLGARREITFTRLDPGEYELGLRGCNAGGVWSQARPLRLRIVPPLWRTTWFRGLLVLGVVGLGFVWHRVRTAALERRNRVLVALQGRLERALGESQAKEEQLRLAFERLRALTRRLEEAKEDERRHIARELHDEMGQVLTAAKITLDLAARGGGATPADVQEAGRLLDQIIDQVRHLSLDLRPPLLDEVGLAAALAGYLEAQSRRSGVEIVLDARPDPGRFAPEIEITAFRVVQEAITNVLRHARATRVSVGVRRADAMLELEIGDDGRGFPAAELTARPAGADHLGLLGMRERVELLGGHVDIRSAPGQGTRIRAALPLGATS